MTQRRLLHGARWSSLRAFAALGLGVGLLGPAAAQTEPAAAPEATASADVGQTQCYVVGMILKAEGGGFRNVIGTLTVPMDWPNQQRVKVVNEELPPGATVKYQTIDDVARRMVVKIPTLASGEEGRALVTFEVEHLRAKTPSLDPDRWTVPEPAQDRKMAVHLAPSQFIDSKTAEVEEAAKAAVGEKERPLEKAIAIRDWVARQVRFQDNAGKTYTVMQTLRERVGDCDELNALCVAMCRACGIPARLIRGVSHSWHEFYLVDPEGQGHWIVSDATNPRVFGPDVLSPLVLQKGDSISVSDPRSRKRVKQRFLEDTVTGMPQGRGARLNLQLVCQTLAEWQAQGAVKRRGIVKETPGRTR
jgi:hypothetical protein